MSRRLRTKIPAISKHYLTRSISHKKYEQDIQNKTEKTKTYYNRTAKVLKSLVPGQKILYKKNPTSYWSPGMIIEKCQEPKSYVIKDQDGNMYRRNRQHILDTHSEESSKSPQQNPETENTDKSPSVFENTSRFGRKIAPPLKWTYPKDHIKKF